MTEIADERVIADGDYTFRETGEWFCILCRKTNKAEYKTCIQCNSPRPTNGKQIDFGKIHLGSGG